MTREEVISWMNQTAVECGLDLSKEQATRGTRYHLCMHFKTPRRSWCGAVDVLYATLYEDNSMTLHNPHDFVFDRYGELKDYERSYHGGFRNCEVEDLAVLLEYRGKIDKTLGDIAKAKKRLKIAELHDEGHRGLKRQ